MVTESSHATDARGSQTTVLVADDSEAIRTRLAALVRHVPGVFAVAQASSASEVWECLRSDLPRVALIDVHLDDHSGGVLMRRIKNEFPNLVLVALTRFAGAQLAATYRDCGADHCFDKTTELGAIIQILAQLIQPIIHNETQKELT